ncbi:MAG: hypothetical protein ACO1OB_05970 [Archangium sp.]
MRLALTAILLTASLSFADQHGSENCETKCNVQASDCMKACSIDPKQAQRPELVNKMMNCLKACQSRMEGCKVTCPKK